MAMAWIWTAMVTAAIGWGIWNGQGAAVGAAALEGAAAGIRLATSLAGALCLWSGVMEVLQRSGLGRGLARLLSPVLRRLFPRAARDPEAVPGARACALKRSWQRRQRLLCPAAFDATRGR